MKYQTDIDVFGLNLKVFRPISFTVSFVQPKTPRITDDADGSVRKARNAFNRTLKSLMTASK